MKFKLTKSSQLFCGEEIEINTLDELVEFVKSTEDRQIVLTIDKGNKNEKIIEIYDTYRE